ncbi:hypothetical protein PGT21_004027 [Puccinia graminis f. sp. tritici]|uniref:RNA polymerase-associated protein LEO1 n=1 Tax=Puccinia graminis f. sp. tritici TaxID=56615 RepID=A0A5B0MDT9_PUCGR|nr:hypothetical protein PGT21_004027 [Puccinia graminis f. sp. tritici]
MSETSNQLTPISAGENQIDGEAKDEETYGNAGQAEPSKQELNDQPLDLEEDLFGGEEDDEGSAGELLPDDDDQADLKRSALEYEEDDDAQPTASRNLYIAEAPLPNLPFPKPSDGKHWDMRIPNFLSFNPLPFSDEEFLNENESSEKEGGESEAAKVLTDQNVIRWRWQKDSEGNPVKRSNARVICWEDGSQSLQVGSELFDMISTVDGRQNNNTTTQQQPGATTQGLTYLFAQHSELKLLEAQASITGQVTLRPYSLNSMTHRNIVANRSLLKANSQRQTSLRVITLDPEKEKIDKELEEERKLKDLKKQDAKLARQNSRQTNLLEGGSRGGVRKRRFNAPLLSDEGEFDQVDEEEEEEEEYEEEMEEDEDENLDDSGRNHRQPSHHEPQLTELELADQKLEEQELDRKKKSSDRDRGHVQKPSKPEPVPSEPKITKRKLIIASDDED